jgi:hypothetical protein
MIDIKKTHPVDVPCTTADIVGEIVAVDDVVDDCDDGDGDDDDDDGASSTFQQYTCPKSDNTNAAK